MYFHVGQLLFANKKELQFRHEKILRYGIPIQSKKPLYCHAPTLLLAEGSPAKHRTTTLPPSPPIKNEALPTPWLG
jgi:hypothetical protein